MKREKVIYLGLVLLIAYLTLIEGSILSSADYTTKIFNLSELRLTRIDVPCEVYLTKGDNQKMVIEAPEDVIERISSFQNNGILTIAAPSARRLFGIFPVKDQSSSKVKIFINHSELDRIIVNEQARIISVDYKPISLQASSEQEVEGSLPASFSLPSVQLSKLGLMDVIPALIRSGEKMWL